MCINCDGADTTRASEGDDLWQEDVQLEQQMAQHRKRRGPFLTFLTLSGSHSNS